MGQKCFLYCNMPATQHSIPLGRRQMPLMHHSQVCPSSQRILKINMGPAYALPDILFRVLFCGTSADLNGLVLHSLSEISWVACVQILTAFQVAVLAVRTWPVVPDLVSLGNVAQAQLRTCKSEVGSSLQDSLMSHQATAANRRPLSIGRPLGHLLATMAPPPLPGVTPATQPSSHQALQDLLATMAPPPIPGMAPATQPSSHQASQGRPLASLLGNSAAASAPLQSSHCSPGLQGRSHRPAPLPSSTIAAPATLLSSLASPDLTHHPAATSMQLGTLPEPQLPDGNPRGHEQASPRSLPVLHGSVLPDAPQLVDLLSLGLPSPDGDPADQLHSLGASSGVCKHACLPTSCEGLAGIAADLLGLPGPHLPSRNSSSARPSDDAWWPDIAAAADGWRNPTYGDSVDMDMLM